MGHKRLSEVTAGSRSEHAAVMTTQKHIGIPGYVESWRDAGLKISVMRVVLCETYMRTCLGYLPRLRTKQVGLGLVRLQCTYFYGTSHAGAYEMIGTT